jgi:hypothetical protein
MKSVIFAGLALLCGACVSSTSSIDINLVEAPIRQFCPAFKFGAFSPDSARTYGAEQVSTYQNGSPFNCRCLVKGAGQTPSCQQVRRLLVLPPEP